MQGLLGLVILILDIVAIVDVLKSTMDMTKRIIWIAVIVLVPIIGMIAYFIVGKKKQF